MPTRPSMAMFAFALLILSLSAVSGVNATTPTTSSAVAGYQVTATTGNNITGIKGSWIVPRVDCSSGISSNSTMSVLIDGLSNTADMMQAGTFANCVGGTPTYGMFVRIVPGPGFVKVAFPAVHAGDTITAQGKWIPKQGWRVQLTDGSVVVKAGAKDLTRPALNSGAFVVGRSPSMNLTNFGTVLFGKAHTGKQSCILTAGFSNHTVSKSISIGTLGKQPGFTLNQINLVNAGAQVMATTSAIDRYGKSFSVTWDLAS